MIRSSPDPGPLRFMFAEKIYRREHDQEDWGPFTDDACCGQWYPKSNRNDKLSCVRVTVTGGGGGVHM